MQILFDRASLQLLIRLFYTVVVCLHIVIVFFNEMMTVMV